MSDPSQPEPAVAAREPRPGPSRRRVLRGAAGAGAAGLAAAVVTGAAMTPALAETSRAAASSGPGARDAAASDGVSEPVVVHVRDVRSGEMDVFAGTRHIRLRDVDLAARLARAAR